jgi:hypothetical protein
LLDLGALRAEHGQAFERVNSLSESRQALGEFWLEGSIHSYQAGVRHGVEAPAWQVSKLVKFTT